MKNNRRPFLTVFGLGIISGFIIVALIGYGVPVAIRLIQGPSDEFQQKGKKLAAALDEKEVAFVDGTGEYSIPYMKKAASLLSKHFSEQELAEFNAALNNLTLLYTLLADHITELHSGGNHLREDDSILLKYRGAHNKATEVMLSLFRKLGERADAETKKEERP